MIRRRPFSSLLLLLALLLAALAWQNRTHLQAFPGIVGAYSAKEYCSCRYVVNNPADYCETYVAQYVAGRYGGVSYSRCVRRNAQNEWLCRITSFPGGVVTRWRC